MMDVCERSFYEYNDHNDFTVRSEFSQITEDNYEERQENIKSMSTNTTRLHASSRKKDKNFYFELTELSLKCLRDNLSLFSNLRSLKVIDYKAIDDSFAKEIANHIRNNRSIVSLKISNTCVTTVGLRAIVQSLGEDATLEKLNLSFNRINDDGAVYLAEMLLENKVLKELDFSWNQNVTPIGTQALCESIKTNSTLKRVNLSNIFGMDSSVMISLIRENHTLTHLSVNGVPLKGCFRKVVIALNERETHFDYLKLTCCRISTKDSPAIVDLIASEAAPNVLDLSSNRIGDKGAKIISKGIKNNTRIKKLVLSKNHFSTKGISLLTEEVSKNPTLDEFVCKRGYYKKDSVGMKVLNIVLYPIANIQIW